MSQDYRHLTGIELIKGFCAEVLIYGLALGLDVSGVKMWISPGTKSALKLNKFLSVDCQGSTYNISIIVKNIKEIPLENGKFQTDIFVGDPGWEVDLAKGEIDI